MFPTTQEIKDQLAVDADTAQKLYDLLDGRLNPKRFTSVQNWIKDCCHGPSKSELILEAANELLDGSGIETVFGNHGMDPVLSYVNMGDTYTPTLIFDHDKNEWIVSSWGAILEEVSDESDNDDVSDDSEPEDMELY